MPSEPEDQIERLFAAEEAAIKDDGFTQRVVQIADRDLLRRRTAIYGAALTGLGFAIGGIVEMAPYLPDLTGWLDGVIGAIDSSHVEQAVRGASDATYLAVAAVLAGAASLIAAVTLQNR